MNTPTASDAETAGRMRRQRRVDTAPEMALRRRLFAAGLRYRVDLKLEGTRRRGDIVFPRRRVVVFVDGCFWHSCPEHGTTPARNRCWWSAKLAANVERDRDTDRRLRRFGWVVLRFWEHDDPDAAARVVIRTVRKR